MERMAGNAGREMDASGGAGRGGRHDRRCRPVDGGASGFCLAGETARLVGRLVSRFWRGCPRSSPGPPTPPPYTAAAAKTVADFNAKRKEGENLQTEDANCVPPGMPRMMQMPYPIEFLFTPGRVTVLTEAYMQVRRIYTDGRKLPDDPDPQFNGNSVGHWEGDTLVVETVGLDPATTLMTAIHPTEQTRIVERIHQSQPGHSHRRDDDHRPDNLHRASQADARLFRAAELDDQGIYLRAEQSRRRRSVRPAEHEPGHARREEVSGRHGL